MKNIRNYNNIYDRFRIWEHRKYMLSVAGNEIFTIWRGIVEGVTFLYIIIKYRYEIDVSDFKIEKTREAHSWCNKNCNGKWFYHYQPLINYGSFFRFNENSDALAFKLRWM